MEKIKEIYNKYLHQKVINQMIIFVTLMNIVLVGLLLLGVEGLEKSIIFTLILIFILNIGGMLTSDKEKVNNLKQAIKKENK